MLAEAAVVLGSLLGLGIAGWLFLDHSLYRDHEEKDPIVQVRVFANAPVKAHPLETIYMWFYTWCVLLPSSTHASRRSKGQRYVMFTAYAVVLGTDAAGLAVAGALRVGVRAVGQPATADPV